MAHADPDKHQPQPLPRCEKCKKPIGLTELAVKTLAGQWFCKQCADFRPLPPRTARIWLDIADDQGKESHYSLVPFYFNAPTDLKCYKLTKYKGLQARESYQCVLDAEGGMTCTCLGFTHTKHCKHLDALRAAGLLDPSPYLEATRLRMECESRMKVEQIGGPKPSRGAKKARAKRLRDEAETTVPMEPSPAQPALVPA